MLFFISWCFHCNLLTHKYKNKLCPLQILEKNALRCINFCCQLYCVPICEVWNQEAYSSAATLFKFPLPYGKIFRDFMIGLPSSHGNSVILVVVDHFSTSAHFVSLPTNYSPYKSAALFLFVSTMVYLEA